MSQPSAILGFQMWASEPGEETQKEEEHLFYNSHQTVATPYSEPWGKEAQDVKTG